MKNYYQHKAGYYLRKFSFPLFFLVLLLSAGNAFAIVTSLTLKFIRVQTSSGVFANETNFLPGQTFVVFFGSVGSGSNSYLVQLSDNTGSFASPVTISAPWVATGNVTNANSKMASTIPVATLPGSYKIRISYVNGANPVVLSSESSITVLSGGFGIGTGVNGSAVNTFNMPPSLCGTTFYDNGGPNNIYLSLSNGATTINGNNTSSAGSNTKLALVPPAGYTLVLTFNSFDIDPDFDCSDVMQIFDGPTTGSPQIGFHCGGAVPGTITSSHATGSLLINFVADASTAATGWDATVDYIIPAPTGSASQAFCPGATVNDLTATVAAGAGVKWYLGSSGGSALSTGTLLVNGTHYFASQTAGSCEGTPRLDVTVTINPLPGATTATAATGPTTSQFTAHWNAASNATAYLIDVATDNAFSNIVAGYNALNVGNVTSINVTGLAAGTTYYYRVKANNSCGNGATSNTISISTTAAPCAPVGGTAAPAFSIICDGATQLLSVSGSNGTNYIWQISTDNISWSNITGATTTTYTTQSADGHAKKYYRLLSKSVACWDVASSTSVVDVSVSSISVTVTATTDNSITLNWGPVGSGNYTVSWTGTTTGSTPNVTPPKTITGLTAGGTYNFTITQTGASLSGCPASGTASNVNTLCAQPTAVNAIAPGSNLLSINWNGPTANYRIFYRPLFSATSYATKDVTNATSTTINKIGVNNITAGTTYELFVARLDCPTTGVVGQPSGKVYVTTPPAGSCTAPVIDSVKSVCPVQIEVWVHGSASNQYQIYLQRLTPTVQAVNSYGITGGHFTVNIGSAGQTYLIAAASKCGTALSNLTIWPGNLTVKPVCDGVSNVVISNPTCKGFTASWNADQCLSSTASYYQLYIRQVGTIVWNSYPVFPSDVSRKVNWLGAARSYETYIRAIYNCNGYVALGLPSQVQTVNTLSSGCREEEETIAESQAVAHQISVYSNEVVSLYPNPSNGQFRVDIDRGDTEKQPVKIEVINLMGQVFFTQLSAMQNGQFSEFINLPENIATGNYFIRITAGENVYNTKVNIAR